MNKETRTFIWGIIIFFISATGLVLHIINFQNGNFDYGWGWLFFASQVFGTIYGWVEIVQTTD